MNEKELKEKSRMTEDLVADVTVPYVGLLGAGIYRTGDVFISLLLVTGVLLLLFPLMLLFHRRAFQSWLSKYKFYPYNLIALTLISMSCGFLMVSSLFK